MLTPCGVLVNPREVGGELLSSGLADNNRNPANFSTRRWLNEDLLLQFTEVTPAGRFDELGLLTPLGVYLFDHCLQISFLFRC